MCAICVLGLQFWNLAVVLMHQSFDPLPPTPLPQAWWGHSLSVSVKASEVPGYQGKNTEQSAVQNKSAHVCRIGRDSLS